MRALELVAGLWLAMMAAGADADAPPARAETAVLVDVAAQLERKDCDAAVRRLNDGLAKQYATVWLLAGVMYEEGLCLKPSWERAQRLYQRAHVPVKIEPAELQGVVSADRIRDRQTKSAKGSLAEHVREVSVRALARYPKPDTIDPAWRTTADFVFRFVD